MYHFLVLFMTPRTPWICLNLAVASLIYLNLETIFNINLKPFKSKKTNISLFLRVCLEGPRKQAFQLFDLNTVMGIFHNVWRFID